MLTLHELKKIVEAPCLGQKIPTAKKLERYGVVVAQESVCENTEIFAYQCGYALYRVSKYTTVFPIASCRGYMYEAGNEICHIPEYFFEQEAWYMRLVLEGEDRMNYNRDSKEQEKVVSYSCISEEWRIMDSMEDSILEQMIRKENVEELLSVLTEQQRFLIRQLFLRQKSQKQISRETGMTAPAVSQMQARAIRRMRRHYPDMQAGDSRTFGKMGGRA